MTEPHDSPPAPAQSALATPPKMPIGKIAARGCGYTLACGALAGGVVIGGDGRPEAWGAALIGILFYLMVVGSSGVNGYHPPPPDDDRTPPQAPRQTPPS